MWRCRASSTSRISRHRRHALVRRGGKACRGVGARVATPGKDSGATLPERAAAVGDRRPPPGSSRAPKKSDRGVGFGGDGLGVETDSIGRSIGAPRGARPKSKRVLGESRGSKQSSTLWKLETLRSSSTAGEFGRAGQPRCCLWLPLTPHVGANTTLVGLAAVHTCAGPLVIVPTLGAFRGDRISPPCFGSFTSDSDATMAGSA